MNILVSACLLGTACRYDGKSKPVNSVLKLKDKHNLIPVCPEIFGGLPTPRKPSEICGDGVFSSDGTDVSENYAKGAAETLKLARILNCKVAIMKEKSPSCGKGKIYSGNFDGKMTDGDGITVRLLKAEGITVLGESEIDFLEK